MPKGGLLFRKVSRSDDPRVRLPEDERVEALAGLPLFSEGLDPGTFAWDWMGVREGNGSDLSCDMLAQFGGSRGKGKVDAQLTKLSTPGRRKE